MAVSVMYLPICLSYFSLKFFLKKDLAIDKWLILYWAVFKFHSYYFIMLIIVNTHLVIALSPAHLLVGIQIAVRRKSANNKQLFLIFIKCNISTPRWMQTTFVVTFCSWTIFKTGLHFAVSYLEQRDADAKTRSDPIHSINHQ